MHSVSVVMISPVRDFEHELGKNESLRSEHESKTGMREELDPLAFEREK